MTGIVEFAVWYGGPAIAFFFVVVGAVALITRRWQ